MLSSKVEKPLIVVVGPTAAGKTGFSVQIAEHFSGEIISADSRQFYVGMDIGTAKPSKEELKRVRHHLIDIAKPDETVSLSDFQKLAKTAIADIHSRDRLPFLVGGTGQYVKAITEGWRIPSQPPNHKLRSAVENWGKQLGAEALHNKLRRLDPEAAEFIQYQNMRRTIRALEVIFSTGRKFSEQRRKVSPQFSTLVMGVWRDRKELYARIDARIDSMIAEGLLEETRTLLQKGFAPDLPALSAIGYKEMVDVLQGHLSMEAAVVLMKRRTREYVRRQANWFKESDPHIHWLDASENLPALAEELMHKFLSGNLPDTSHLQEEDLE
jgi:tRNA dimethylallyltransferase